MKFELSETAWYRVHLRMSAVGDDANVEPLGAEGAASFGKYHLFASLGRGGMADVFLAVARGPLGVNKLAVIKRLRSNLASDSSFRRMFIDEARLATRLNHPNVVHTYEVGEENGVYCIAMEYLEGQPLNRILRESVRLGERFDQRMAARISADALAGLQHAHELCDYDGRPLQIVHRDVSPHNIFVNYSGQVKLVDFGIAKAALSTTETEVGVLKGKIAYMSPEQATGDAVDQRSDIFAMGICLWEMLVQRRLMGTDSAASTMHRLLHETIPAVSSLRHDVDPELEVIVTRALEKDARQRFQTAGEMREALERFLSNVGPMRSEQVGGRVSAMFETTLLERQRQIQRHMEMLSRAENTAELEAINAQLLGGLPVPSSGGPEALKLGMSGTPSNTSGIISVTPGEHGPSIPPRAATESRPTKSRSLLALLLVSVFLLGLAVAAIVLLVVRGGGPVAAGGAASTVQAGKDLPSALGSAVPATASASPSGGGSLEIASASAAAAPTDVKRHADKRAAPHGVVPVASVASVAPLEPGFLTIDTYPYTHVSEGGQDFGTTPLVKYALAPGRHTLSFDNEEKDIHSKVTVEIHSGEVTNRGRVAFR